MIFVVKKEFFAQGCGIKHFFIVATLLPLFQTSEIAANSLCLFAVLSVRSWPGKVTFPENFIKIGAKIKKN